MYNSLCLMVIWYGGIAYGTISKKLEEDVNSYYSSDNVQSLADKWKVHQASVENAIQLALKETFGNSGLNVYVNSPVGSYKVSKGFLVDDNVVHVLFKDMNLVRYPYLKNPRVSFPLHQNMLQVEATVSKMFVDSKYLLFRNFSDVVYTAAQRGHGTSPFSLQQVQNRGQAMIIVEHCVLFGYALATLQGVSVALGQENFKLHNCKFSLEVSLLDSGLPKETTELNVHYVFQISTPGVASAPLMVPYFSEKQGTQLAQLLMLTLHRELMPKLQGAVLTCVNTSSTIGSLLPKVRKQQRSLFKKTSDYLTNVIKSLNKITSDENAGTELWKDYRISWTDKYDDNLMTSVVSLTNMTISGLDSAYSAHIGGPYKQRDVKIVESVRFSGIQFRGAGIFQVRAAQSQFIFSGEVQDVMTSATFQITVDKEDDEDEDKDSPKKLIRSNGEQTFELRGWRNLEIHGPKSPLVNTYSFITGYLLNQLPKTVVSHLSQFCREAIIDTDNPNARTKSNAESRDKPISGEENGNENDNTNLPPYQEEPNDSTLSPDNSKAGSGEPINKKKLTDGAGIFYEKPMFGNKFFADKKTSKEINVEGSEENENTNFPSEHDAANNDGTGTFKDKMFDEKFFADDKNTSKEVYDENSRDGTGTFKDKMFDEKFFADDKNTSKEVYDEDSREKTGTFKDKMFDEKFFADDKNTSKEVYDEDSRDRTGTFKDKMFDEKFFADDKNTSKEVYDEDSRDRTGTFKDKMFDEKFFADDKNTSKEVYDEDSQDRTGTFKDKMFDEKFFADDKNTSKEVYDEDSRDGTGTFKDKMFDEKFFADDKNTSKEVYDEGSRENKDIPSEQDAPNEERGTSLLKEAMFTEPFFGDSRNNPKERNVAGTGLLKEAMFTESFFGDSRNNPKERNVAGTGLLKEAMFTESFFGDSRNNPKERNVGGTGLLKEAMFTESFFGDSRNNPKERNVGGTGLLKEAMFTESFFGDGRNNPKKRIVADSGESIQDSVQDGGYVRRKHFKKPVRSRNYRRRQKLAHISDNEIN